LIARIRGKQLIAIPVWRYKLLKIGYFEELRRSTMEKVFFIICKYIVMIMYLFTPKKHENIFFKMVKTANIDQNSS
jgi:hypothetical protein